MRLAERQQQRHRGAGCRTLHPRFGADLCGAVRNVAQSAATARADHKASAVVRNLDRNRLLPVGERVDARSEDNLRRCSMLEDICH